MSEAQKSSLRTFLKMAGMLAMSLGVGSAEDAPLWEALGIGLTGFISAVWGIWLSYKAHK